MLRGTQTNWKHRSIPVARAGEGAGEGAGAGAGEGADAGAGAGAGEQEQEQEQMQEQMEKAGALFPGMPGMQGFPPKK